MPHTTLTRLCTLAVACASLTACDRNGTGLEIVPEFDDAYSFETGMENWSSRALDLGDPPSTWEVLRTNAGASDGSQSVQLRLDNTNGQGKIWIERRYAVPPDQEYEITMRFALGSADDASLPAWPVLASATPEQPATAADLTTSGDTWNGSTSAVGQQWTEKTVVVQTKSDAAGEIFIYVGIGGMSSGLRTHYVDNVRATFLRKGISAPTGPT